MREHEEEAKENFGDATRSKQPYRFDLIPPEGVKAEAHRFWLGAEKHGEGNWKHGNKQFVKHTISHLEGHIQDLKLGKRGSEEWFANCGAIKWAGSALAWYAANKPEVFSEALSELNEGIIEK